MAKGIFARKSVADFEADLRHGGGLKRTLGRLHLTALGVGAPIGAGIIAAGASKDLRRLMETASIPAAATLLALGALPPNYSLSVFRVALRYRF